MIHKYILLNAYYSITFYRETEDSIDCLQLNIT